MEYSSPHPQTTFSEVSKVFPWHRQVVDLIFAGGPVLHSLQRFRLSLNVIFFSPKKNLPSPQSSILRQKSFVPVDCILMCLTL